MRLEPELWNALAEICRQENVTIVSLIRRIEAADLPGGRTSAVRVFIVSYFRAASSSSGSDPYAAAEASVAKRPVGEVPDVGAGADA